MGNAHKGKHIAYYRVSTDKQGRSGLGLAVQRKAVTDYLNGGRLKLVGEFTEIESGKRNDRQELTKALRACKAFNATLVVAKLDRLARNAAFLKQIVRESGERGVVFCDMPNIPEGPQGKFVIGMMAEVAELEAGMISQRTKGALAAAKARGVKLGTTDTQRIAKYARKGQAAGAQAKNAATRERALGVVPIIEQIREEGITTLAGIAQQLNEREVATIRGGHWSAHKVWYMLRQVEEGREL